MRTARPDNFVRATTHDKAPGAAGPSGLNVLTASAASAKRDPQGSCRLDKGARCGGQSAHAPPAAA